MLISIITINYNDKLGLERTVKSVLSQRFENFEHIIIDGNSSDGSKEVIDKYADKFSYCISEPDSGIFNAMNKGIKVAKGEYLLFLNSGDTFYDDNVLLNASEKVTNDYDIYYGDVKRIYPNGKEVIKKYPKKLNFNFFVDSAIAHQSSIVKRSLFDKVFYFNEDYKVFSDWEFFVCAICKFNIPYKHLDTIVANFDMDGISSQPEIQAKMHKEREETYNKYFPLFYEDYKNYNKVLSVFKSKQGKLFLKVENNKFARKLNYLGLKLLSTIFK